MLGKVASTILGAPGDDSAAAGWQTPAALEELPAMLSGADRDTEILVDSCGVLKLTTYMPILRVLG